MWSEKVHQQERDDCSLQPVRNIRAKEWKNVAQWSKVHFADKVPEYTGRIERTKIHVAMIWDAMLSAGFSLLYFFKFIINTALYDEILEQIMLLLTDMLYGNVDHLFQ